MPKIILTESFEQKVARNQAGLEEKQGSVFSAVCEIFEELKGDGINIDILPLTDMSSPLKRRPSVKGEWGTTNKDNGPSYICRIEGVDHLISVLDSSDKAYAELLYPTVHELAIDATKITDLGFRLAHLAQTADTPEAEERREIFKTKISDRAAEIRAQNLFLGQHKHAAAHLAAQKKVAKRRASR